MKSIQIKNILLWQKNGKLRNLELRENMVNVITGDSGKGKSSILHIIDYCLLASEARGISKANIDSKVNWYGIRLNINGTPITIARPSQESGIDTQAYYSDSGVIPDTPELNVRIDNLKKTLNSAFGIDSDLRIPYGGNFLRAGTRVSFRNFLGHCYQDQTTITSAEYLYMKPNDGRFQEGIQRTFRMALGIENARTALIKSKLEELQQKKASISKKSDALEKKRLLFSNEISALAEEAMNVGALDELPQTEAEALKALQRITTAETQPPASTTEVEKLEREIFIKRSRNRRYSDFLETKKLYKDSATAVEDALKPVEVINQNFEMIFASPLANSLINHLQHELLKTREQLKQRNTAPFIGEIEELIKSNKGEIRALERRISEIRKTTEIRTTPREYFKYMGRLEAKIDLYAAEAPAISNIDESDIDEQLTQLKGELEDDNTRVEIVKRQLDYLINERLSRLRLKGYADFRAYFDEVRRMINLYSEKEDMFEKMPDIGSASNYLYLHLAYFLSIHQIAKMRETPWMPSFLVFDQPSGPYFSTTGEPTDDIKSLDAALIEMDNYVSEMRQFGGFQILLLEHIEASHWEKLSLNNFHLVDRELRDGYGLIL